MAQRPQVGWLRRLASAAVLGYVRHSPVERGKYRLLHLTRPFLLGRLAPGVYLRLADLNHVETRLARDGRYEPATLELFASLLAPGMTVVDVGANVGAYTLVAADRVGEGGRVHAFEPTPATAAALRANLALNGFTNVAVNEVAVSDAAGEVEFHLVPESPVENTLVAGVGEGRTVGSTRVRTVTLDGYAAEHGLRRVDLIKLDIEGAEVLALRGAAGLLAGAAAPLLVLEINPRRLAAGGSSADELTALLAQHGYTVYPVETHNAGKPSAYTNAIAARPAHWDRFPALARWPQPQLAAQVAHGP